MIRRATFLARLAPALCLSLLAACGGDDSNKYGGAGAPAVTDTPRANTVDWSTAGSIAGTITFEGTPPEMPAIVFSGEDKCATMHTEPVHEERVLVGPGNGLKNCVVYLEGPSGYAPPSTPVELDQVACRYVPHVFGIQVGQTLRISNSDDFLHNVHYIPLLNEEENLTFNMPMTMDKTFTMAEQMIVIKCNVHSWMKSYAGVFDHPFFAVTAEDGAFEIKGVPPGSHTLVLWHEEYGRRELAVEVTTGAATTVNESFTPGS